MQTPHGEDVAVTFDGATQQAVIGPSGAFSTTFNTASLPVPRLPFPISYVYKGDGFFSGADTTSSLTVTQAVPTLSVVDGGGTYKGTSFPAAAGVTGINGSETASLEGVTPTLAYYAGTDPLDSATLLPAAPIEAGTYTVIASFAGSTDYESGTALVSFTITQATPSVTVADAGGTYSGKAVAATGAVAGVSGSPSSSLEGVTPTLAYYSGTDPLDSATLLPAAPTQVGTYTVRASFAGSTDYGSGTALVSFTIIPATPRVSVADAGGTYSGAAFAATGAVAGVSGSPSSSLEGVTPTLAYYSGTDPLDSVTLLSAAPTQVGTYTVRASFAGSADYESGTALVSFTITQATPSVTVADAGGTYSGAPFAATGAVAGVSGSASTSLEGVTPTLAYYSGTDPLDSATLLSAAPTQAGSYTATASFAGSADYVSGTALLNFTITQATPTFSVTDVGGSFDGRPFAAAVTIAGTGTENSPAVSLEGIAPTLAYSTGAGASLGSTAPTAVGNYTVVANFPGSVNYLADQSAPVPFTIARGSATIVLTSSLGSAGYGQLVSFTSTVASATSGTPSGSVTFSDAGTLLATVPLDGSGIATFSTSMLAIGAHSITATYSGDVTFLGGESAAAAESVSQAGTQVVLVPQPVFNNKKKLTSVGLKAEIEPLSPGAGIPTGEVTFETVKTVKRKTKTTTLGAVALSGGDATLTLNAKKVLNVTIKIVYSGDTDFQASTATPLALSQSGLKGLARPMVALVNRGRPHLDSARTITTTRGQG